MLSSTERRVTLYDARLAIEPVGAPVIDLGALFRELATRVAAGEDIAWELARGSRLMHLSDCQVDHGNQTMTLLVSFADVSGADVTYQHVRTRVSRAIHKHEGEGNAVSAHLVVALDGGPLRLHAMAIEQMPGLGRAKLTDFLQHALNPGIRDTPFTDADGRQRPCRHKLRLDGRMSDRLRDALTEGLLQDVELVAHEIDLGELEQADRVTSTESRLKLNVEATEASAAAAFLIGVRRWAQSKKLGEMRVHFKQEGRRRSARVAREETDPAEALLVQTRTLSDLHPPMGQHCDTIHAGLVARMRELVVAAQNREPH